MIIAYLLPALADEPRDGIGFICCADTEDEAIKKLKAQFAECYNPDEGNEVEWHTDELEHRPHVTVQWKSEDDGAKATEFYWLHTATDEVVKLEDHMK